MSHAPLLNKHLSKTFPTPSAPTPPLTHNPTLVAWYRSDKLVRRKYIPFSLDPTFTGYQEASDMLKQIMADPNTSQETMALDYEGCTTCECNDAPICMDMSDPSCLLCLNLVTNKTASHLMHYQPGVLDVIKLYT